MLNTQTFMWLLRAGVLTYARSFDHPGSVYVVRGGSTDVVVTVVSPIFMPASLQNAPPAAFSERYEDIRRLRIAQALDRAVKAGGLTAHTKLWLHARLAEITGPATPQSV